MAAEWLLSALIIAIATPTFGHFETVRPTWTRILRWFAYLAVTGVLGVTVSRPWTLIWVLGLPTVGAVFHVIWCLRHGINPLTAEPRDRYEQLRRPLARGGQTMTGHHHGPGSHTTAAAGSRNSRYLAGALALILAFMAAEVVVAIIASSLALISDAGHMLTDAAAMALALIAVRLAARPAAGNLTYGWKRVEILRAGERHHPVATCRLVCLRGHSAADSPA